MSKFLYADQHSRGYRTLPGPIPQRVSRHHIATQLFAVQQFAKRRLFTVVVGWLAVVAMGACAVCAQSTSLDDSDQPASPSTAAVRGLRRDEDEDIPSVGPGAASYTRYSSDLQTDRSTADQLRKCRDRAARDGLVIAPDLEFSDEAMSGANPNRPGFADMMAAARAGRIKILFVESLSRLARDSVVTMQTFRELVYLHQVRVVSIYNGVDTANDSWEVLTAIFGVQNEHFLKSLAKFVFRGQEGVVLDGLCVGDYCLGYKSTPIPGSEQGRGRNAKPKKQYIIEETEAEWVKRIFHWYVVEKRSLRWMARELNERGAPKDHRAKKNSKWRPGQLPTILTNRKYIGWWPWGTMQNVRNPMTGKIRQEPRSAAETNKYLRHFPELQIIDEETFVKAGERLQQCSEALGHTQRWGKDKKTGRRKREIAGSTSEVSRVYPRHLLSGLIECGSCGQTMYVGGKNSAYMFCINYHYGVCECKTTLRRDLAEELILAEVAKMIQEADLRGIVLKSAQEAWQWTEATLPSELHAKQKALAEVEQNITNLIDSCERKKVPLLEERLNQRQAERHALRLDIERLTRAAEQKKVPPTEQWVDCQLKKLHTLLSGKHPAAALALQSLIAGRIVVTEIRQPGKDRHYLQGRFRIKLHDLARAAEVSMDQAGERSGEEGVKEVVIDFRKIDRHVELADEMKAYLDSGKSVDEVLEKFGCSYTLYDKAMDHWHRVRGLERPDGRSQRGRIKGRRTSDKLRDQIMELWHAEELTVQEIAEMLDCGLESIREAVVDWHEERGLAVPDGRARRKAMRLKKASEGGSDAA